MRKGQHLSEEAKATIKIKLLGRRNSMKNEWARGHIPFNKGTKGLTHRNKTSFKKGNIPANYRGGYKICKDGIYVLAKRGHYKYGNISVGKYEQLARVKYREKFGDFPKEMIIFHKDGDMFNNEIKNLELISRKELLKRNQYKTKRDCIIYTRKFFMRTKKHKTCSPKCRKEYAKVINVRWRLNNWERDKELKARYRLKKRQEKLMKEQRGLTLINTN